MQNQIHNSDEINLSHVADKVKGVFSSVNNSFFNIIQFVVRNIIIIVALIIIGVGLGTYLDMGNKIFTHKIIVMPNFKSVNYLYEEVDRINAKVKEGDYAYLEKIGIPDADRIVKVKIDAIVDIYEFIDDNSGGPAENDSKFQLFKLISENGDMNKMLEDNTTSKYYQNHVITITTQGRVTQKDLIDPFLLHLEDNTYFKDIQKTFFSNLNRTLATNDSIAKQIDAVISAYASSSNLPGGNLVSLNEKTSINDLLKTKQSLAETKAYYSTKSIENSKVIKDNGILLNTKVSGIAKSQKFILPILFLFLFSAIYNFRKYYKREVGKRKIIVNAQ
jgi:hypothetical protein